MKVFLKFVFIIVFCAIAAYVATFVPSRYVYTFGYAMGALSILLLTIYDAVILKKG